MILILVTRLKVTLWLEIIKFIMVEKIQTSLLLTRFPPRIILIAMLKTKNFISAPTTNAGLNSKKMTLKTLY